MRRIAVGLAMSLALHGLALFGMILVRPPAVSVEYEIDVVDAPPAPPEEGSRPEPRPQRAAARARRVASESGSITERKPEIEAPETDKPAPPLVDLQPLAPASARLTVLLRTDRLRKSPLSEAARAGMTALPDGELAVVEGLEPLDDFDALLVATANPRDVTETFLAARLAHPERVKEKFHAPGGLDPRILVFPAPNVAILGRPEHVAAIGSGWVKKLGKFADDPTGDALLEVTVNGLHGTLELGSIRVPLPRSGMARLSWPPALRARLVYDSPAEAQQLAQSWPSMSAQIEGSLAVRMFGFGGASAHAKVEAQDRVVTLEAPLEQRHLEAISNAIRLFMAGVRSRNPLLAPTPK